MEVIEVTEREVEVIEVVERGPAGPTGATGPQGPAGAGGVTSVTGTAPISSSGGTTPAISISAATTSAAGSMSSADKTKLDGVATGATANSSDATLLARANHTGTQAVGTITGLGGAATLSVGTTTGTVAAGDDARLSDARTPTSHAHGNITNDGKIGSTAGLPVITTTAGAVTTLALGTANQVLRVNSGATGVEFGAGFDAASPPAIGGTTPAAITGTTGTFTTLSAAPTSGSALTLTGGTVTASAPLVSATQTWNNAAVTFTGLLVNATNTASASASLLADFQTGGTSQFSVRRDGQVNAALQYNIAGVSAVSRGAGFNLLHANCIVGWGGTGFNIGNVDLTVEREAADIMAQRRTTNAQTFRIYNTFTDASNYERGFMRWSSNILQIGTEKLGTGSRRTLEFVTDGTARWRVGDGSITAAPSMLARGNAAIFGADESYNVIIVTGAQGTVNAGIFSPNTSNTGYLAIGESLHLGLTSGGTSGDVRLVRDAANVLALRNSTTAQAYRIYNTVSGTSNVNFERANFRWASNEFVIDAEFGGTGTALRGIKIGSATSSLLGFYGATPAAQPAAVADATDAATVITQLNALLSRLRTVGIIAT
jgi:hypothetical protein